MTRLKLLGDRIAVVEVKEEVTGSILIPETASKSFTLGRVIAVGDGGPAKIPIYVQPGDLVMFQLIGPQSLSTKYLMNGTATRILLQDDLIARLKGSVINYENFEIIGKWLLLQVSTQDTSMIVIPKSVKQPENFLFHVAQLGNGVTLDVKVGQEVFVERLRCNPIEISGVTYGYVTQADVHGHVETDAVVD